MKSLPTHLFTLLLIAGGGLFFRPADANAQAGWHSFKDARLVVDEHRDGDSFIVEFERAGVAERRIIRLYFVDAPEMTAAADADRRRVVEQMRYFGVEETGVVFAVGKEAAEFTRTILAEPFTLHTAFANAPGRSAVPRIYAIVTSAGGKDLGAELVGAGLARTRGVKRALPDGTPGAEHAMVLGDLEVGAMLRRRGIWKYANAGRIAELRARERKEKRELKEVFEGSADNAGVVNINTASQSQLQSLHGIGQVLSQRIIEYRPFQSVDDLLEIPGVSVNLLDSLRYRLSVE